MSAQDKAKTSSKPAFAGCVVSALAPRHVVASNGVLLLENTDFIEYAPVVRHKGLKP